MTALPATAKHSVIIETSRYRITGNVCVPEGQRLSDYANDPARTFFALTEATVSPLDQLDRQRSVEFTMVNRGEVCVLTPGMGVEKPLEPIWDDRYAAALGVAA